MEKINLKDVIDVCSKFIESNGKNTELIDLESKLIIKNYLPMDEKAVCITKAFLDADKDYSIPSIFIAIGFDIAILFDCLLSYVNIDIEKITDEEKTYENYDLIYQSGLGDYILNYCKQDYERLVKMVDKALSIEHVSALLNSLDSVDSDSIESMTNAIVGLKNNADKEMIHDMATIAKFSDPEFEDLKDKITEEVLDRIYSKE